MLSVVAPIAVYGYGLEILKTSVHERGKSGKANGEDLVEDRDADTVNCLARIDRLSIDNQSVTC